MQLLQDGYEILEKATCKKQNAKELGVNVFYSN